MIVKVASRGAGRGPSDIRRQTRALSLLTRFQRQPLPPPRQLINDGSSSDIRLSIFLSFFPLFSLVTTSSYAFLIGDDASRNETSRDDTLKIVIE